jgi:peptidoglycan-associated lipoprotein
MKFSFFALLFTVLFLNSSCTVKTTKAGKTKEPLARKMLQWDNDFVEYGKVKKGEKREHVYKFKNISKEDINIMICTACDCTTLDWTTKTIKPGESGQINTIFNSSEKSEQETIRVTIILKNEDPVLHYPIVDEVKFHFDLEK